MGKFTGLLLFTQCFFSCLHAQKIKTVIDTAAIFDNYVQKAVKDWQVPGLAIVVVKNNQAVFKKAYGTRELGTGNLVNTQTLFACASTTKAMTAACMGILADEGKLKWDDPVIDYLPAFRLQDPYVTRELRIRDLFLHNSGVGNTDFLWGDNSLSSTEVLEHMRLVKPSYSFRSGFTYQNIFYLVAGMVIEKVSGMSWQSFVTQRIFKPLGMTRTSAAFSGIRDPNMAMPHYRIADSIQVIEHGSADVIAPAGAVWSCIDDMAIWLKCMLDSSKYTGGRLVTAGTWKELLKPQTIVSENEFYPTQERTHPNFTTYALGWFQQDYMGRKLNFHTGSLSGAIAIHAQMPEEGTGVFIFGNLDHAEIRHALMFKALDLYATGGLRDWSTEFQDLYGELKRESDKKKKTAEEKRVTGTHPTLPLDAYTGHYKDALYGSADISLRNGKLAIVINSVLKGSLEHWNYDSFMISYDKSWYDKGFVTFIPDINGAITDIALDGILLKKITVKE